MYGCTHTCAWCRGRSQEWVLCPLELELLEAFLSLVGARNGTCVLLQEQQVLLTTKSSLQHLNLWFKLTQGLEQQLTELGAFSED